MATNAKTKMIVDKAARLAILLEMEDRGLLENMSYQRIADMLAGDGESVNRSTILRDIQDLPLVRERINQIYRAINWRKRR